MVTIAPKAVCPHNAFYPDEDGNLVCINCGRPPIGTIRPEPKPERKHRTEVKAAQAEIKSERRAQGRNARELLL